MMPLSRADKLTCTTSAVQLSAADSRAISVMGNLGIAVLCHMHGMTALSWLLLHYTMCCQPVEEALYVSAVPVVLLVGPNCGAW